MAKAKSSTLVNGIAKDLNPKDSLGVKGYGNEPKLLEQPTLAQRSSVVGSALNWYNYFYSNKEAKQFIIDYLISIDDTTTVKQISKVSESKFVATYGWIARLSQRGLILSDDEKAKLTKECQRLITSHERDEPQLLEESEAIEVADDTRKRNVQVIMKERAIDVSGELLGLIDDYVKEGCKTGEDVSNKVVTMLAEKSILPQHVSIILEPFDSQKKELQEAQSEKDEQLVEGYSHFGKIQVKNLIKFIDQIIGSINSYVALKQTTKAKRAKRPVPIAKIVSKLKYMRKFKDDAAKLDLVSIEPEKLHQSAEAWVYDTAKRKLYHFVADEMSKCLIVKGNTLLGFDTKESEAKILRKPEEQLKQIMGSKPAARKFFKEIKAVATTPNGRFNAAMIIVKAF
jgi:hypothetical protein